MQSVPSSDMDRFIHGTAEEEGLLFRRKDLDFCIRGAEDEGFCRKLSLFGDLLALPLLADGLGDLLALPLLDDGLGDFPLLLLEDGLGGFPLLLLDGLGDLLDLEGRRSVFDSLLTAKLLEALSENNKSDSEASP